LIVTAVGEGATGVGLLVAPPNVFQFLLGISTTSSEALLVGRIAGAALVAIGIACWFAKHDLGGAAQRGLLIGILAYDVIAAALLAYAGLSLDMHGVALWPAATLHGLLAIWCLIVIVATVSVSQDKVSGTHP
jgi:predicted anti-sigma-YlaC factor YlaD